MRSVEDRGRASGGGARKARILVLIKCLDRGGAERLVADLVASGDKEAFDYEVAFVLERDDTLVPSIRAAGVPVHNLGARGNWDLSWLARYRELLRRGRFDIVHSHLPYAAALGRLVVLSLPRSERPKLVYTEHSLWHKTSAPVRTLNRLTIGLESSVLAVSDVARDALPAPVRERTTVVVHGIDLASWRSVEDEREEHRASVREELGVEEGEVLAFNVANLRQEKGVDVLMASARMLFDDGVPVRFASIGVGPLREQLDSEHDRMGLGDRFKFLGQRLDVLRLLAGSDLFVLSSHHEGLPVALMEASSVGLPIVATRVGGIPTVLEDGVDALLVEPGNPAALAQAIRVLVNDEGLRVKLGEATRAKSSRFDINAATATVEGLYRELLSDSPKGS